jgi:hypothetical protein
MYEYRNRYHESDFHIPDEVAEEAQSALLDIEKAGKEPGYKRRIDDKYAIATGHILAEDGELDIKEVERMLRYFKEDAESSEPHEEADEGSPENVIWRLWGGAPGKEWVYRLQHYMKEIDSGWKRVGPLYKKRYAGASPHENNGAA